MMSSMVRRICHKGTDPDSQNSKTSMVLAKKWFVAIPVELGDFFHNFADGLVIGIAFRYCDIGFAWKIVGISVAHELPQELADIHVLVNKAGLHWSTATIFNVISGSAVLIGSCLTYFVDIGSSVQGLLLALGAGVFLFVGMTQLGTSMLDVAQEDTETKKTEEAESIESQQANQETKNPCKHMIGMLFCFILGALVIGLILIDHEHCSLPVGESEVDPHAGHAH